MKPRLVAKKPATGPTCELVHNRVVRIELTFAKQDSENLEMATKATKSTTAASTGGGVIGTKRAGQAGRGSQVDRTRNLEIPIAICIAGIVYLALLYSVILYLE